MRFLHGPCKNIYKTYKLKAIFPKYVHLSLLSHLLKYLGPHVQCERGKVIGVGVHMFICLWTKKNLNSTLAIDSPFQTYAVGLLVEFID